MNQPEVEVNDAPPHIDVDGPRRMAAPLGANDFNVLLSANVGAMTSLGYLTLIAIGLLHEVVLFRLFGVNVLDWMGPTDFLLVPVRDPLVMVAAVAPIVAGWFYWKLVARADRAMDRVRQGTGRVSQLYAKADKRMSSSSKPLWIAMLVLWAIAAALWYALYKSKDIRAGNGRQMRIEWVDAARGDTASVVLLGANASYLVIYRPAKDSTQIVPASQVLRVNVARRAKK